MDNLLHIRKGEFTIVTGYTNQGKSEFMDSAAINLIKDQDWKIGFISMEKSKETHVEQMLHKLSGKRLESLSKSELDSTLNWIRKNAFIVDHLNIDKDIDTVAEVIRTLSNEKNIDAAIIDPFNYIDSVDDKLYAHVMEVCKKCTTLAKECGIHIFLVAHAKEATYDAKTGQIHRPKLYSVFGGSQLSNIVDNLISVTRYDSSAKVETLKVRDQDQDSYGVITLFFNKETRMFYEKTDFDF